jgi:HAD superfamily hydrolase (TIGR01549 family)
MIKAVFFDAIDTLFQSYPSKIQMYRRLIRKVTGKNFSTDQIYKAWGKVLTETENAAEIDEEFHTGYAWDGFNSNLLRALGIENNEEKLGEKLRQESWGNPENYKLYDDVMSTLLALEAKGVRIACVSNEDGFLNNFFEHFKIGSYFEFVMTSEEVGYNKPDPRIFEAAAKQAELAVSEIIFVGDSLISDYFGASGVGMKSVLIDRGDKISDDNITKIISLNDILELLND